MTFIDVITVNYVARDNGIMALRPEEQSLILN